MFCVSSLWCTLHGSVFNLILLLLLACHSKAVFSDPGNKTLSLFSSCCFCGVNLFSKCPGMVPLPETAIDFSDLRSQSSRMNDRVCVQINSSLQKPEPTNCPHLVTQVTCISKQTKDFVRRSDTIQ